MNSKRVSAVIEGLRQAYIDAFDNLGEVKKAEFTVDATDATKAVETIAAIRNSLSVVAKGTSYDGARVSKFSTSYNAIQDGKGGINYVEFTVRSNRAEIPVIKKVRIDADKSVFDYMAVTMLEALVAIYAHEVAAENVDELNAMLDAIYTENEIKAGFKFAVSEDKFIVDIDDNTVTFGVSPAKALEIGKQSIFRSGNEWEDDCRERAVESLVEVVKTAGTTPKIVKAGIPMVTELTECKSKRRVDSLIRQTVHKQAKYLSAKGGIGYVEGKTTIDGDEVDVFALVKKEGEQFEVVLSPFDVRSLFNVEFDAIAAINA